MIVLCRPAGGMLEAVQSNWASHYGLARDNYETSTVIMKILSGVIRENLPSRSSRHFLLGSSFFVIVTDTIMKPRDNAHANTLNVTETLHTQFVHSVNNS